MNDHLVEKVWRVRMKYSPEEKDYSSTAWKHGEVGIWYGAWSVEDFEEARNRKEGSIEDHLNRLPTQRELIRLNAQATVRKREIDTVKRFFGIASSTMRRCRKMIGWSCVLMMTMRQIFTLVV